MTDPHPSTTPAMVEAVARAMKTWKFAKSPCLDGYRICGVVQEGDSTSFPWKMFKTVDEASAAIDELNATAAIAALQSSIPADELPCPFAERLEAWADEVNDGALADDLAAAAKHIRATAPVGELREALANAADAIRCSMHCASRLDAPCDCGAVRVRQETRQALTRLNTQSGERATAFRGPHDDWFDVEDGVAKARGQQP